MSRREQEIWQACDDLLALGKTPREITGEAIGNRLRELHLKPGSLTYRYRYRDSWMEERGLTRESLEEIHKPSDIIERSAAIFRNSIEESIRNEYELKHQAAKKEAFEAGQCYEAAQQALEIACKQKDELIAELSSTREALIALKQQFSEEREKRLQFEERTFSAEQLVKQQRSSFEKQLNDQKFTFEAAVLALKEANVSSQSQYQSEIDNLRTLLESKRHEWLNEKDALNVEKSKLERSLDRYKYQEEQGQAKLSDMIQFKQGLESELKTTQTNYYNLIEQHQLSLQELAAQKTENGNLHASFTIAKEQQAEIQKQLLSSLEQAWRLEERLKMAQTEIALHKDKKQGSKACV